MIQKLPLWANLGIIFILSIGVLSVAIVAFNITIKFDKFIERWDDRIKLSDERYKEQSAKDESVRQTAVNVSKEAHTTGIQVNRTLSAMVDLIDAIRENIAIRLSEHTIHVDRELGDINGNLTKILDQLTTLLIDRTPLFESIIENEKTLIRNQYQFSRPDALNVSGVSNITYPLPELTNVTTNSSR